jgi:predicted dehydrogenase
MKQVKTGVIGVGRMGQNHCRVYSSMRQVNFIGVFDIAPTIAEQVALKYEVEHFDELDRLLEQVEAVSVTTPTPSHFDLVMECIQRGIHVLVEKPVTQTLEQAGILTHAAESSGLVIQVGHIERFNPTYIELKNVLDDLSPLAINFRRLSPFKGSNTDVDVVLDLMTHDLDLVLDLLTTNAGMCECRRPECV